MSCLFCKLYEERRGIIYETEFFYSRFDGFPISPGHAEVMPKRHVSPFFGDVKDPTGGIRNIFPKYGNYKK